MKTLTNKKGFALIEVLIATVVISIVFTVVASFLLFSRDAALKGQRNFEAISFAEEALEVVRKLRDDSWEDNIETLTNGTTYYPVISANAWTLSTTNPDPNSYYTTTLVFSSVNRDSNDDIVTSGGTLDEGTKKVTATVAWNDSSPKTINISTYITNFSSN